MPILCHRMDGKIIVLMNIEQRDRKSMIPVNLGLGVNIFLAGLKTFVGVVGHSPALLAEGINSTSDVAYYVAASIFMRMARKPADTEHPYGHRQLESIAALVVGSFVVTTGVAVFWGAVNEVYDLWSGSAEFSGASQAAFWIALLTVGIKILMTTFTLQMGRQTHNALVMAMAYDHRNDIFSATAAAVGIFLGQRGYPWVDPLAGALVALLILRTGIQIVRESSVELMDAVPGDELRQQVSDLVSTLPEVNQLEEVQAHRFGPYLVMNITICIDGTISVAAGDRISEKVERLLHQNIPLLRQVHIHYHPGSRS